MYMYYRERWQRTSLPGWRGYWVLLDQAGYEELKPEQREVVTAFINGNADTFVCLPTGYGSLCYRYGMLPYAFDFLRGKTLTAECPSIVI